jgi:hypothetical protein
LRKGKDASRGKQGRCQYSCTERLEFKASGHVRSLRLERVDEDRV